MQIQIFLKLTNFFKKKYNLAQFTKGFGAVYKGFGAVYKGVQPSLLDAVSIFLKIDYFLKKIYNSAQFTMGFGAVYCRARRITTSREEGR